ncbi:hypothetical protein Q3W71_13190 [Micromonospora sp. C28SCA-DRY-2]|uniref:hypothetical protein n=1 Tax=Micromonospora sp. C28SCA-DRY-2 TaxID=3059522 RepID=UPI00267575A1|nr:hypothetical protein [Micromonospora sp. C28SCA-DRY-2]MDO3702626.1 hypothetical protein [Micromonospora sp. C28SCA-DRY-2]
MSGRWLGRLAGSLLVLAAAAVIVYTTGLYAVAGNYQAADIIWTISPGDSATYLAGDIIWTVSPGDAAVGSGL